MVQRSTARNVLRMWSDGGPGILDHMQTRRFLDPEFVGVAGAIEDPPLRSFVQRVANGERLADMSDAVDFQQWLSAFRLVPWRFYNICLRLYCYCIYAAYLLNAMLVLIYCYKVYKLSVWYCRSWCHIIKVRVVEQSTEGLHSRLARVVRKAPSAKLSFLSMELRFNHLVDFSMRHPAVSKLHVQCSAFLPYVWTG